MTQQIVIQKIGHITVFFSTLDFFVTRFIIELVTDDYKATKPSLNDNTTLGAKLARIEKLQDQDVISPQVLQHIKNFLPEAMEVSRIRNRFMHDQWVFNPETLAKGIINRVEFTDLKGWNTDSKLPMPYTEKDLEDVLSRIGALQTVFANAVETLQRPPAKP